MSEEKLVFRIALHARTEHEAKKCFDTLAQLFDEEYFIVKVEPKRNRNPNVALEWFALLAVYERGVVV